VAVGKDALSVISPIVYHFFLIMKRLFLVTFFAFTTPLVFATENTPAVAQDNETTTVSALPVEIASTDPKLHYMGRFDLGNASGPTCAWSGSAIALRFHGTAINAKLLLGNNRFEVVVDGLPTKVLVGTAGKNLYNLASGLSDSDHTVMLFKDTEANVGMASFQGFQLSQGGTVLPYPSPSRQIEVIGDSISCGYGNEAASNKEHFSPATENAYWSYGAITARAFGADYTCIAWSGKKLWPDNSIVALYDRVLPTLDKPVWKFDSQKPNVVLINLCSNDFGPGNPEQEGWVKAYHAFVDQVRKNYPDATIYLALGSMMSDDWPRDRHALSTARGYIQRVVGECNTAGDAKIHFLEFEVQNAAVNGLGADWHPSLKTHKVMAQKFIDALKKDLGWAASDTSH